jgi:ferredoxin
VSSPFEVLDVARDADEDEIQRAYRERVKEAHPDHGGSAREFQRVRAAYEELKDGAHLEPAEDEDEAVGAAERATPRDPVDTGADGSETRERLDRSRVEYLNYELLDDYDWDLDDPDLFETAAAAGLDQEDYGEFWIRPQESMLEAAERHGLEWPFACRGGACANCAVMVIEGEMTTRIDNVLPQEMIDDGFQLSCNGIPLTEELKVVHNVKHIPALEELLLPPRPFEQAYLD